MSILAITTCSALLLSFGVIGRVCRPAPRAVRQRAR
jgi:hypothetical protein